MFVSQNMAIACRELSPTFPIKNDLTGADVTVGHVLLVHEVQSSENLLCQMIENWFWNSSNTLCQIVKTSIRCVVLNYWDATLRTVPLGAVNFDETIWSVILVISWSRVYHSLTVAKVMLPISNPVNEHLPDLNICDWNFFNGVDFQRWAMKHLLDRTWGWFEDSKGYHLIKSKGHFYWLLHLMLLLQLHHHVLLLGIGSMCRVVLSHLAAHILT